MFEHKSQPLLSRAKWHQRVFNSVKLAVAIIAASLTAGIIGYHFLGDLPWIDSLLEASMILGGMGPVAAMQNDSVKIFASAYSLYSGLVILGLMGILLGPWVHRMMHHFHAEGREDKN